MQRTMKLAPAHMLRCDAGRNIPRRQGPQKAIGRSLVPDLRLIQDYLGHKNIKNTARYTRTSARRFEGLWD
jgi:hypothetical protein